MEDCTTKVLALVQQFAGDKAGELTTYLCQTAHNATEALIEATEAHHNLDTLNATVLEQADAITTVGDSLDGYFVLANAYLVFFMQGKESKLLGSTRARGDRSVTTVHRFRKTRWTFVTDGTWPYGCGGPTGITRSTRKCRAAT
eukprot:1194651-Prorocentrum_minimum.AAC.15